MGRENKKNKFAPGWMELTEQGTGAKVYVWAPGVIRMRDDTSEIDGALSVEEEPDEIQRRHVHAMLRWERARGADVEAAEHADEWRRFRATQAAVASLEGLAYHLALCCRSWGVLPSVAYDYGRNLAQAADGETTPDDILRSLRRRREQWPEQWRKVDDDAAIMLAGQLHAVMARHAFTMASAKRGAK